MSTPEELPAPGGTFKKKRGLWFRILRTALALILIVSAWLALTAWRISSFGSEDRAQNSDCAIVLGAAAYDTRPSPVFEERIKHAITLYRAGTVRKIIFTGGYGTNAPHAESSVARDYAVAQGVAAEDILIETSSRTTQHNLAEALRIMNDHDLYTAVIISDPFHLKRASLIATELGIKAVTSPTPTTRYRGWKPRMRFLMREVYFYHHYLFNGD